MKMNKVKDREVTSGERTKQFAKILFAKLEFQCDIEDLRKKYEPGWYGYQNRESFIKKLEEIKLGEPASRSFGNSITLHWADKELNRLNEFLEDVDAIARKYGLSWEWDKVIEDYFFGVSVHKILVRLPPPCYVDYTPSRDIEDVVTNSFILIVLEPLLGSSKDIEQVLPKNTSLRFPPNKNVRIWEDTYYRVTLPKVIPPEVRYDSAARQILINGSAKSIVKNMKKITSMIEKLKKRKRFKISANLKQDFKILELSKKKRIKIYRLDKDDKPCRIIDPSDDEIADKIFGENPHRFEMKAFSIEDKRRRERIRQRRRRLKKKLGIK
jgi:hypothetical protein